MDRKIIAKMFLTREPTGKEARIVSAIQKQLYKNLSNNGQKYKHRSPLEVSRNG